MFQRMVLSIYQNFRNKSNPYFHHENIDPRSVGSYGEICRNFRSEIIAFISICALARFSIHFLCIGSSVEMIENH